MFACAAGRLIEAIQASHPALSSTSVGRSAAFTRRLVLEIAHLPNEAMRTASLSTNSLSSASGNARGFVTLSHCRRTQAAVHEGDEISLVCRLSLPTRDHPAR